VPSSAAELAAAVVRSQAVWRLARRRASRPLLMSCFLSRVKRGAPKLAPREPTMPRFQPAQKRLSGVFLWKSGETMIVFSYQPPKKGLCAERVRH
jgi:hypothetical protein